MTREQKTLIVHLLNYGAGNVQSVIHALESLGVEIRQIDAGTDWDSIECLIFPGVGAFSTAMESLDARRWKVPLLRYLHSGRPFLGICIGMQVLFESSHESPGIQGLGILRGTVSYLGGEGQELCIPHMGWNRCSPVQIDDGDSWLSTQDFYYFVHSFGVVVCEPEDCQKSSAYALTRYGSRVFVSAVRRGNIFATQFHPEKSGMAGLKAIKWFIQHASSSISRTETTAPTVNLDHISHHFTKRIIACLDVRTDEQGQLVVTKGDQYDVRATNDDQQIRNLGHPVQLAERYYREGADELVFLNITSFRQCPLQDLPMLQMLKEASKKIFIPLTVGGGIRPFKEVQPDGTEKVYSALEVADQYFRSGADKVSIGSDAVLEAESFWKRLEELSDLPAGSSYNELWRWFLQTKPAIRKNSSSIEQISMKYGRQAVVISIDPKRIYVSKKDESRHFTVETSIPGPHQERYCWYACTIHGGRDTRDFDVVQLALAMEHMGAGEFLVNCIDRDGQKSGYDVELLRMIKNHVGVPVVASSGAGSVQHFSEVLQEMSEQEKESSSRVEVDAALAAGIFHRRQVPIEAVKKHLIDCRIPCRPVTGFSN